MSTKVQAVKCDRCKDIIYSVARHDYHYCTCGGVSVDGGYDYTRIGWKTNNKKPESIEIVVNATQRELYDDWNKSYREKRKYGIIKETNISHHTSELGDIENE